MKNTYLYIRFSDEKQAQGSSYARQLARAKEFCPTLIEDNAHIFFDAGKSAFKGENLISGGELKRFYDAVKDGSIPKGSILLVEDLDRLSRAGMWKASDKLRELVENGIVVITLRDNKRYAGVLNISDGLTSLIKQDLANEESAKKSDRVAKSYMNRYAEARAGKKVKVLLPSWLEWHNNNEYKLKLPEANIVARIFEMAATGYSYGMIVKELNSQGVEPFRSRGQSKLWITASVYAIVKSRAAIGTYLPRDGGEPILDYFPSVVSKEIFSAAQGARAERKRDKVTRAGVEFNLWSKIGICELCRRPLHCLPKGRNGSRYLVCSGKSGGSCNAKNVRADRAELVFIEVLINVVNADYFIEGRREEEIKIRQLTGRIDELRQSKDKLLRLLEVDAMPELLTAIKKVNAELSTVETEKNALEFQVIQNSTIEQSRAALMMKIDLEGAEARMKANALLRQLAIVVTVRRVEQNTIYTVLQRQKKILEIYDQKDKIVALSYSQETAQRMYDRGEVDEAEHNIDLGQFAVKAD